MIRKYMYNHPITNNHPSEGILGLSEESRVVLEHVERVGETLVSEGEQQVRSWKQTRTDLHCEASDAHRVRCEVVRQQVEGPVLQDGRERRTEWTQSMPIE